MNLNRIFIIGFALGMMLFLVGVLWGGISMLFGGFLVLIILAIYILNEQARRDKERVESLQREHELKMETIREKAVRKYSANDVIVLGKNDFPNIDIGDKYEMFSLLVDERIVKAVYREVEDKEKVTFIEGVY